MYFVRDENPLNGAQLARIGKPEGGGRENAERKKKWRERKRAGGSPYTRAKRQHVWGGRAGGGEAGGGGLYYKRPRFPSFRNTVKPCIAWRKIICTFNRTRIRSAGLSFGRRGVEEKTRALDGDVRFQIEILLRENCPTLRPLEINSDEFAYGLSRAYRARASRPGFIDESY